MWFIICCRFKKKNFFVLKSILKALAVSILLSDKLKSITINCEDILTTIDVYTLLIALKIKPNIQLHIQFYTLNIEITNTQQLYLLYTTEINQFGIFIIFIKILFSIDNRLEKLKSPNINMVIENPVRLGYSIFCDCNIDSSTESKKIFLNNNKSAMIFLKR